MALGYWLSVARRGPMDLCTRVYMYRCMHLYVRVCVCACTQPLKEKFVSHEKLVS